MEIFRDIEKNRLLIGNEAGGTGVYGKTDFREKMLVNNHIKGILELTVCVTDNRKTYEYDTTGLNNLGLLCTQRKTGASELKQILLELCNTVINGQKFMLEDNDFVIDPEYIFLDKEYHPYLAYCPGYDRNLSEQMGSLAEYLMNRIDYRDKDAVLLTYTIYMKCREEGFFIGDLAEYLKKENFTKAEEVQAELPVYEQHIEPFELVQDKVLFDDIPVEKSEKQEPVKTAGNVRYLMYLGAVLIPLILTGLAYKAGLLNLKNGRIDPVKTAAVAVLGIGLGIYMAKKFVPGSITNVRARSGSAVSRQDEEYEDEATELLYNRNDQEFKQESYSLVSDRYPEICIDHFPFTIGKDRLHTDHCLEFHGVSRLHAKIDKTPSGLYISDTNSTNGVYVNEKRVEVGIPCPINPGDKVEMGVCTYTLKKNNNR